MERENVVVIGAGHAGLATSRHLKNANIDHVIFEAGRVAETWISRRWESFCLVTPNWTVALPGATYSGPDPDGFMPRDELVHHIQSWATSFGAPVRKGCLVESLDQDGDGFLITMPEGKIHARTVVVASGGYQKAHLPPNSDQIPSGVKQVLAEDYGNPSRLPAGAVVVVGSGQTGCQLAEELHDAGRKVFLACGRAPWGPRRFGGHDLVWWTVESGWWNRTPQQLPSPKARLLGNALATGHGGGHDLNLRTLHALGVELLGHYRGAEGDTLYFADDFTDTIDASDGFAAFFKKAMEAFAESKGIRTEWELPEPMRIETRTQLDIAREGIGSVIWTTGYRPAYGWVHFPVFDDMGFPVQEDGHTSVPGLYFMGVHFQRKAQSAVLYGAGEDAEIVVTHIAENRR